MALAAKDLQATVAFYQEVFDLESSELTMPGEEPNVGETASDHSSNEGRSVLTEYIPGCSWIAVVT